MNENIRRNKRQFGKFLETEASSYLQQQGLRLVTENYQCKMGEIDLIMRAPDSTLVFVEVRYRSDPRYGGGAASVGWAKQRRIIRTAKSYLQRHNLYDKCPCRFDVVAISQNSGLQFNWIKDAFWAG